MEDQNEERRCCQVIVWQRVLRGSAKFGEGANSSMNAYL